MSLYQIHKWIHALPESGDKAIVWCPKCDLRAGLDHDISDDGTVTPSLVCPHDGCDFHEWVQLAGWPNSSYAESKLNHDVS